IVEEIRSGLLVATDDVGLAAGSFHFPDRAQLLRVGFQPFAYLLPFEAGMPTHVLLETSLQRAKQCLALLRIHSFEPFLWTNPLAYRSAVSLDEIRRIGDPHSLRPHP